MKKLLLLSMLLVPAFSFANEQHASLNTDAVPVEFFLFGLTLLAVAIFHNQTLKVALAGLTALLAYKLGFTDFNLLNHLKHEWTTLINLLGLLLGFAILAKHFEESGIPQMLPKYLPNDWKGGFVLLCLVALISSFLDNIAAAIIGGTVAMVVFDKKVHIGYIAAIVAASNAGGSGSVVGDTTTTMMWIDGISPLSVINAYTAAIPAIIILGFFASKQQDKYQRIKKDADLNVQIDFGKIAIVALILIGAILTNVYFDFPALGVWIAIGLGAAFKKTPWHEIPEALKGSLFLLSLVLAASMMPVEKLPEASWQTTFSLGFISAVFDNIPLTKLALTQGGYDWSMLAYAVGYGGSMIWFGSSAGVALASIFPQAKSVGLWIKNGWHVILAYIVGFFIMLSILGWNPTAKTKNNIDQHSTLETRP
jgi:Na+/H+ antiporter NhaD/arsenite permease-like protein